MNSGSSKRVVLLLITAMIWGAAFVAQSVGMDYVGPFTFQTVRYLIGSVFLIPCIAFLERTSGKREKPTPEERKNLWLGGLCCGSALCVASALQQFGLLYTTVGKAGFITTLYVVMVPLLSLVVFRKRIRPLIWFCVVLSLVGLYCLCMTGVEGIGRGDLLVLLCALCFSVHILIIDHFSSLVDPVRLSRIQFGVAGLLSAVPMFLLENPDWSAVLSAWKPILYTGILSSGVAYTLQAVAQRDCDPTVASLVLCLESVFSVLFGWLLLGQALTAREIGGCVLIFAAIVLAQLPEKTGKIGRNPSL